MRFRRYQPRTRDQRKRSRPAVGRSLRRKATKTAKQSRCSHLSKSEPPVRIFIILRSRSSVIIPPFLRTRSSSSGSILFRCDHVMRASQKRRKIPVRLAALCGGCARLIICSRATVERAAAYCRGWRARCEGGYRRTPRCAPRCRGKATDAAIRPSPASKSSEGGQDCTGAAGQTAHRRDEPGCRGYLSW
jgi:hypothetical protein